MIKKADFYLPFLMADRIFIMSIFITVTLSLLEGLLTTFKIFALTLLAALPLGLIISFGSMSKIKIITIIVKRKFLRGEIFG